MTTVICARGLSKHYSVAATLPRHDTLRDEIMAGVKSIVRRGAADAAAGQQSFWALDDVSFDIEQGQVVGFIGRNGAGKSTLLKILSRITQPTKGRAEIHGRVGSLLEVGTGFDRELTGRENVYLSGAILGMKKREIDGKFDEIVAFAEIERFLDTPVKRYSSGMYMKLAFSVAAHLDPEILIVDEVLAVGDFEFQKKCLGKMGDAARSGRTVILVSHNMGAIDQLCTRVVLMEKGKVAFDGAPGEAIRRYQTDAVSSAEWVRPQGQDAGAEVTFQSIAVRDAKGMAATVFSGDEPIGVEVDYVVHEALEFCLVGARVLNASGENVFGTEDIDGHAGAAMSKTPGRYQTKFSIPGNLLYPGRYTLLIGAHSPHRKWYELIEQAAVFDVSPSGSLAADGRTGMISPLIRWETSTLAGA